MGHSAIMKNFLTILLVTVIFAFSSTNINVNAQENNEKMFDNEVVLVVKIYNNWDEAKYAENIS